MSSITIPTPEAAHLAASALKTYKARAAGFPALSDEQTDNFLHIVKTGHTPEKIRASDEQIRAARTALQGEDNRRGLVAAVERAEQLARFFTLSPSNMTLGVFATVSFEDWVFMAYAETLKAS